MVVQSSVPAMRHKTCDVQRDNPLRPAFARTFAAVHGKGLNPFQLTVQDEHSVDNDDASACTQGDNERRAARATPETDRPRQDTAVSMRPTAKPSVKLFVLESKTQIRNV